MRIKLFKARLTTSPLLFTDQIPHTQLQFLTCDLFRHKHIHSATRTKNQFLLEWYQKSLLFFTLRYKGGGIKREKRKYKRGKEFKKKFKDQVKKAREIANYSYSNWYILALNWQWVSSHKYPPKGYIRTSVEGKQTLTRCETKPYFGELDGVSEQG